MVSARMLVGAGWVAAGALTLTACSASPQRGDVTAAARTFVAKLQAGDGAAACDLLTDDARSSVAGATNQSCAQAIKNVDERGRAVAGVQVWGDAAQVRIGQDVVFLRRSGGDWKVSAAGCKPQPAGPYDCDVGG